MRQENIKREKIQEMCMKTWPVHLKGKNHFKELDTDGSIILKGMFMKGITNIT
jgi:hypothetical protein